MRTTVTIEPDVERLLRQAMQQTGDSFKSALNSALRRGLAETVPPRAEKPFVVKAKPLGLKPGIDPTKMHQLSDDLEVEAFLEVTRRLNERRAGGQCSDIEPQGNGQQVDAD